VGGSGLVGSAAGFRGRFSLDAPNVRRCNAIIGQRQCQAVTQSRSSTSWWERVSGRRPRPVVRTLEETGYMDLGEAGVHGRLYLRRRGIGGMGVNLAVTLHQAPLWRENILVRDLLRSEPTELPLKAVRRALETRRPAAGLIQHADREADTRAASTGTCCSRLRSHAV
jgi:hypothetical protein